MDLNILSVSLMATFSVDIPFLKKTSGTSCVVSLQIMAKPIVHNVVKYFRKYS